MEPDWNARRRGRKGSKGYGRSLPAVHFGSMGGGWPGGGSWNYHYSEL